MKYHGGPYLSPIIGERVRCATVKIMARVTNPLLSVTPREYAEDSQRRARTERSSLQSARSYEAVAKEEGRASTTDARFLSLRREVRLWFAIRTHMSWDAGAAKVKLLPCRHCATALATL